MSERAGSPSPRAPRLSRPATAGDANDDGAPDIADPIFVLTWQFLGGRAPPPPSTCGPDPTPDRLGPCVYRSCP